MPIDLRTCLVRVLFLPALLCYLYCLWFYEGPDIAPLFIWQIAYVLLFLMAFMWALLRVDEFLKYRIRARRKSRLRRLEKGKADVTEIPVDQFCDAVARLGPASQKVTLSVLASMLLLWLAAWVACRILRLEGADIPGIVIAAGFLGVLLLVFIGAHSWLGYRARRDPRLVCPRCTGWLYIHYPTVIATRNCPRCGGRALCDPGKVNKQLWLDPEL
jgi:hypothetical protein